MRAEVGHVLRLLGLMIPPLAVVLQLPELISVKQMLAMAAGGAFMFWAGGKILQSRGT